MKKNIFLSFLIVLGFYPHTFGMHTQQVKIILKNSNEKKSVNNDTKEVVIDISKLIEDIKNKNKSKEAPQYIVEITQEMKCQKEEVKCTFCEVSAVALSALITLGVFINALIGFKG